VDHDDDFGGCFQGFAVAGLLVGAVTVVAVVHEDFESEFGPKAGGLVAAAVVHDDDEIDDCLADLGLLVNSGSLKSGD
jgi:hypothetical protein